MHNQQMLHSLLSIQNMTENIRLLTQSRIPKDITKVTTCPNISIPSLELPFPDELDSTLRTLGLSERGYSEAYCKIQEWVHDLQSLYSRKFQRVCRNLASLPRFQNPHLLASAVEHMQFAYQQIYSRHLPLIKAHILAKQNSVPKNAKTPFNNEYTPLLELYFEQNPYPSLPDRELLARKSMMTTRQIDVWFQNHRARAKKDGKVIKKLTGLLCQPQLDPEFLKDRAPFLSDTYSIVKTLVDNEFRDDESLDNEALENPSSLPSHPFSQVAPPHAFPTTYPPNLVTDPFPNEHGKFMFPPPIWMRTPTQPRVQTAVSNIDEFISLFASKLHLRDGSRRKCDDQHTQNIKRHKKPWFNPVVVVPSSAPHPALIRNPSVIPLSNKSSLTLPRSSSRNPIKPRKISPFSKRAPSVPSVNHDSKQLTAFSTFASRTSSLSSVASSQSRSSSLSSVSSVEPATPPLSPTQQDQNLSFTDPACQLLDELFGPEPSPLFNNMVSDTSDFLFATMFQKDLSNNSLYDLPLMFPPAIAQVHC